MTEIENKLNLLQRIKNTVEVDVRTNQMLHEHALWKGEKGVAEYFRGRRDYAKMVLDTIINEEKL